MLYKRLEDDRKEMNSFYIYDLVPTGYLVRNIKKTIDFDFIYDLVESFYSPDRSRSSLDLEK